MANWLGEKLEDKDGFVPKTMLCLPIFNGQRDVIGVAQLINKVTNPFLTFLKWQFQSPLFYIDNPYLNKSLKLWEPFIISLFFYVD